MSWIHSRVHRQDWYVFGYRSQAVSTPVPNPAPRPVKWKIATCPGRSSVTDNPERSAEQSWIHNRRSYSCLLRVRIPGYVSFQLATELIQCPRWGAWINNLARWCSKFFLTFLRSLEGSSITQKGHQCSGLIQPCRHFSWLSFTVTLLQSFSYRFCLPVTLSGRRTLPEALQNPILGLFLQFFPLFVFAQYFILVFPLFLP